MYNYIVKYSQTWNVVQTSKNFILPFEGLGDTVCIKSCSDPKINLIKIILGDFVQAMYRASTKEQVASASLEPHILTIY